MEDFLFLIISLLAFILGMRIAYLKLYKKDSWLYKESERVDWLYDLNGIRTWILIIVLIFGGGTFSLICLRLIVLNL